MYRYILLVKNPDYLISIMDSIDRLYRLKGKTALITGGGGVLAGAIGCGLARAGVKIILADIKLEKAKVNVSTIIKKHGVAQSIRMDTLDTASIKKACLSYQFCSPEKCLQR